MSRTQKELKALRQQQRDEAVARQRARDRRNLLVIGGVLGAVALGILVVSLYLAHQADVLKAGQLHFSTAGGTCSLTTTGAHTGTCLGTAVPDEGRNHIDPSTTWRYQSYPPASGPHFSAQGVAPVAWQTVGTLAEGQYIHNLEHGGIAILYNCSNGSDCSTLKDQLTNYVQNLAPKEPQFGEVKFVMTPYSVGMQKKVALVAWDYIEWLDSYDQTAITKFYENHVDQGPEQIP